MLHKDNNGRRLPGRNYMALCMQINNKKRTNKQKDEKELNKQINKKQQQNNESHGGECHHRRIVWQHITGSRQ